jgi:dipeptidyl aminopeptidase/acylaminoacyl peptidase
MNINYKYKYIKYKTKYDMAINSEYNNKQNIYIDDNMKHDLQNISNIIKFNSFNPVKGTIPDNIYDTIKLHPKTELISMIYKSDNLAIHGYIFKSKTLDKIVPVVIYCRGGNNKSYRNKETNKGLKLGEIVPGSFYGIHHISGLLQLVEEGKIIVFASNYRESSLSEGVDEFGGKDVNDIENLYPIIKKYKYSDHANIAVYGWSRGVMMSLLLHKRVNWIKCMIFGAGNINLLEDKIFRPKFYNFIKNTFKFTDNDLRDRSAINWVDKLRLIPILILHGSADKRVSVQNAYVLGQQLQKKILYKLVIYPNGNHGLTQYKNDVANEIINWLNLYLIRDK